MVNLSDKAATKAEWKARIATAKGKDCPDCGKKTEACDGELVYFPEARGMPARQCKKCGFICLDIQLDEG
jgi:hypothetical protein